MKKYLMSLAAIALVSSAFVSCSKNDELYNPSQAQVDKAKYEQAFLAYVGGKIAPSQDWGFSTTRGNAGTTEAETEANHNMNHNEWADPDTEFGGWLVPDALTDKQKERVRAYFQANPNLGNYDPQWRHFFVQQVYKGGTAQAGVSNENIIAADDSEYDSNNMNLLSVGQANIHINDFNAGDCTTSDVLNNGQKVGGTTHEDQITLMVNIDDTSCFGYHETGSSMQHNNKWALVSAATIDAWAATHGNPGEAVTDKWNRSFMGFDLALREGAEAYDTDAAGNVNYATYAQAPEAPEYAWDGESVIRITTGEYETVTVTYDWGTQEVTRPIYKDEYKNIMGIGFLTTNENFYVAEAKVTLDQTISINRAQLSSLSGIQNCVVLKEVMDGTQWYQAVINLPKIEQLVNDGYLPVKDNSLTEWVKVGKSDGYFTDWIVTLTEAQRIGEQYDLRIIAEDLTASQGTDFDFNDVVIDVKYGNPAKLRLMAAGGTLPLRINEDNNQEVHKLFGVWPEGYELGDGDKSEANPNPTLLPMVNTGAGPTKEPVILTISKNIQNAAQANDLKLEVYKNGEWVEMKAPKGEPACKLAVTPSFVILPEYQSIKGAYPLFVDWVNENNPNLSKWWE